jgi:hypothetical protein
VHNEVLNRENQNKLEIIEGRESYLLNCFTPKGSEEVRLLIRLFAKTESPSIEKEKMLEGKRGRRSSIFREAMKLLDVGNGFFKKRNLDHGMDASEEKEIIYVR